MLHVLRSTLAPARTSRWRPDWPLALSFALIALWVVVPAALNPGQWADHFEQFTWAHAVEWGYYKHPPLPTWLLAGLIGAFGPSPYWTYVLAALCTAGTGFFTYRIAQRLLPAALAPLALLLWGLQQAFSARAQLYNHNTVMMLAVSAGVWCVLQACSTSQRRWWLAAGVAAGCSMLSKYQAVVPLAGVVLGLLLTGELRRRDVLVGLAWATACALLLFLPHLVWMVRHDFATLHYASQHGQPPLPWSGRGLSVASFLAQQVRLLFPTLLLALLLWTAPGVKAFPPDHGQLSQTEGRVRRAWFLALIAFPLVVTVLTCPTFGLPLENEWGFQCLQFVSLWLAWRLRSVAPAPRRLAALALAVQLPFLAVVGANAFQRNEPGHRDDALYPARALAQAVLRDWQRFTPCPLKIVAGPSFEAGMVSVYSPRPPVVLENGDFSTSPWVSLRQVQEEGAVYVSDNEDSLPEAAVMVGSMKIPARTGGHGPRVYWAVIPPTYCTAGD